MRGMHVSGVGPALAASLPSLVSNLGRRDAEQQPTNPTMECPLPFVATSYLANDLCYELVQARCVEGQ